MKVWQRNLGSSLIALSLAIAGLTATLEPLGVSKTVLVIIAISGGVSGCAGVFFSHLFNVDQTAAVQAGAAVDAATVSGQKIVANPAEVAGIVKGLGSAAPPGSLVSTLTPPAAPVVASKT